MCGGVCDYVEVCGVEVCVIMWRCGVITCGGVCVFMCSPLT